MFTVRIWDLPTRLFHWLLALSVFSLVATGQAGGNAMVWHFRLGYLVLTLLVFRVLWGLVGGYWSRWWRLPISPASVLAYLRGQASPALSVGHSPTGALAMLALLGLTALQASTGLFSDDEIANAGPLSALVSSDLVSRLTSWHKGPGKLLLLAMVVLHVTAMAWYRRRKGINLVPPMVHGDKQLAQHFPASIDGPAAHLLALLCLSLAGLGVRWLVNLGG